MQLTRLHPISPHGVGGGPRLVPGYTFTEVSWREEALAAVERSGDRDDDEDAYLLFPAPSVLTFRGEEPWVPAQPIFVVGYSWGRSNLGALWNHSDDLIALVRVDLGSGIVIDNDCGYLAGDPDPDEIVYEVAAWPSSTGGHP
jgi:hypothetical protein